MLRCVSIALFAVLLSANVVSAEAITLKFLNSNSHAFTVDLGVPVTITSTLAVADLAPTLQISMPAASDGVALAGAVSSASVGPRPQVALSVTEPATLALLGIGFLLLSAFGRRRRERSGRRPDNRLASPPRIL